MMTTELDLPQRHREQVVSLLDAHVPHAEVWAYGSRVQGTSHSGSDLDLVLRGPELQRLGPEYLDLLEAIEESTVPILIEVFDWARLPKSFHAEIERSHVVLRPRRPLHLADVADIVMGQSPASDTVSADDGVPLLNGPTEFGSHHPVPVQFTSDARRCALKGDILFCVRGSTTGRMNWADGRYAIGRGIAAIRHKTDPRLQPFVRGVIENELPSLLASATGSTFPNVSAKQLSGIAYPSLGLESQQQAASALGALDDKIELNRRMCETLEAIAHALYRAWFVDFEPVRAKLEGRWCEGESLPGLPAATYHLFPDVLVDSDRGSIPIGWKASTVSELCDRIDNGGTPRRGDERYWSGSIPWFVTAELRDGPLASSDECITELGLEASSCKLWPPGTILIALYAAPTVGRLGLLTIDAAANQACCGLQAKPVFGPYFIYSALRHARDWLQSVAVGSAQQNISQRIVRDVRSVVADSEIHKAFNDIVSPIWTMLIRLTDQSRILTGARETLLPELISGRLQLPSTATEIARHTVSASEHSTNVTEMQ